MAGVSGQPAPKPSSLKSPVAAQNEMDDVNALLADFDSAPALTGGGEAPAPSGMEDVDQLLADFGGGEEAAPPQDEFAPEPTPMQANIDQLNPENFITRLQAGLAANDTQKAAFLKQKYGEENVRIKGEKLYYRKPGEKAFKKLDPDAFELISDILPDFAREIVTEAALLPGEILGGMAGSAIPVLGTAAGAVTGRVATIPYATSVADDVARRAGLPDDPNRNIPLENTLAMGAESLLPVVGKVVGKTIAKRIPGTAAYKESKALAERELVALSKGSKEVVEAAAALERDGVNIPLMLHQIQNDSPKVKNLVDGVADASQFINKQTEFNEGFRSQFENHLMEIAKQSGKGPVAPDKLGSTITNAVESIERIEGEKIGKYRSQAMAKLKNQKQPLPPEIQQNVKALMDQFGFKFRANPEGKISVIPPKDLRPIVGTKGLTKTGEVRSVVNALQEIGRTQTTGGARLSDLDRIVSVVGDLNPKLRSSAFGADWGRLTASLRQHRRNTIGNALETDFDKQTFNNIMDEYSLLRQNTDQLSSVLRGDVTAKTVVNGFFKGKENLANIRALKSITGGSKSAEWGALKEEFVNQLMTKHANDGPTGYNSKAFMDDLEKNYGSDFIREVIDDGAGPNYAKLKNFLTVGKRIEATQRGVKADQAPEQVKKGLINTVFGFIGGMDFKKFNGIQSILGATGSKENAIMEILNRDGFDKYIANYRGPGNKKDIADKMKVMLDQYNAGRAVAAAAKAAGRTAKEARKTVTPAGKRISKAITRQEASEGKVPSVIKVPFNAVFGDKE